MKVSSIIEKPRKVIQSLPHKKQYIEFFTALLSIPIMMTAIILNINALRPKTPTPTTTPPSEKIIIISSSPNNQSVLKEAPTQEACNKNLPDVAINNPEEGERVSENPVCITPELSDGNFCATVWKYSINNNQFSEYDNKAFCLYNIPSGDVTLRLRVKSIVTGKEKEIIRRFTYSSTVTPSPVASSSAN